MCHTTDNTFLPEISLIIPVYNVASYIQACIKSVLSQTFSSFEVLVIDDCGTDDSVMLAEQLLSAQDRIGWRIIRHSRNAGLSAARNTGIEAAKGRFIVFADSDDWLPAGALEHYYTVLSTNPGSIVCGNTTAVTDGTYEPYWFKVESLQVFSPAEGIQRMLEYNLLLDTAWAKMFPKKLFTDNGIQFPEGLYFEDTPTNLQLFTKAETIIAIPQEVYFYRRNRPGSILQEKSMKTALDRLLVFEKIFSFLSTSSILPHDFAVTYYLNRLVGEYRNVFKVYKLTISEQQQLAVKISDAITTLRRREKNARLRRLIGVKFNLLLRKRWYKHFSVFCLLHNGLYSVIDLLIDCYIF